MDSLKEATQDFFGVLGDQQRNLLENHLKQRMVQRQGECVLQVVLDVTHACLLSCRGCGVAAKGATLKRKTQRNPELSTDRLVWILGEIRDAAHAWGYSRVSLHLGGGEPFLRKDMPELIRTSADLFGSESISVDTNGCTVSTDELAEIMQHVQVVGISLDGLEEYHNWWRQPPKGMNAFRKATGLLSDAAQLPFGPEKLEVSLVPTKKNIAEIPGLMELVYRLGVRKFSVHRAMPVGRFLDQLDLLPDAKDYLIILTAMLNVNERLGMAIHIHHSIESIYSSLLLGLDSFAPTVIRNPERFSSLGIDPIGRVYFDPWCMARPLSRFDIGSLEDGKTRLTQLLEQTEKWHRRFIPESRCFGCQIRCSGGSRIGAALALLEHQLGRSAMARGNFTIELLLDAMSAVDPVCPLYKAQSKTVPTNHTQH